MSLDDLLWFGLLRITVLSSCLGYQVGFSLFLFVLSWVIPGMENLYVSPLLNELFWCELGHYNIHLTHFINLWIRFTSNFADRRAGATLK